MRKILIFILLLGSFCKVKAQVKHQTGSAEFGLPLFQWEDDRSRLSSAVSLSYTSSNGLKVGDVASNVGQGWSLQIGGSVSRMQSGEPDDQKPRDGNYDDISKYPPGYLYDPISALEGCPKNLTEYPIFNAKNKIYKSSNVISADKEIDKFAFEVNGKNGIFFLSKNNGDKGTLIGDSKMKVWFTRNENMPNIRTTINAFYVQDENGIIYKFANLSLTKVLKNRYSDATGTRIQEHPKFEEGNVYHEGGFDDGTIANPYIVNTWMLTEMEDPFTNRKIIFNYTMKSVYSKAGVGFAAYSENLYAVVSHFKSITESPEISSITYPDGHTIYVNYGENRVDLNGQNTIKSVDIMYGGRYISKYELNTQYFLGNRVGIPYTDYQKSIARLCLTSIKKYGVDLMSDDAPYKFEYYMGSSAPDDIVPPPFHYKKDIWGYYNGNNNQGYHYQVLATNKPLEQLEMEEVFGFCFIRFDGNSYVINPKNGYAKNGLLKKILYPTGGSLKYEYEQNTGLLNGQNTTIGGVHVSKSIASDEGNNYNCDVTNLTTNYNYVSNNNPSQSSMWGIEIPFNKYVSQSFYNPEVKKWKWGVKGCGIFGCCKYKYKYPGLLSREQAIDLNGHQRFLEALSDVLDVVSMISTVLNIVNVILGATGIGAIIAAGIDIWVGFYILIRTCTKNYSKFNTNTVYYNNDLNNNPLPMQYSRVEVFENTGQNGKTVMEFTSPSDYPIWEPTNPAFSNKQRYAFWAYGLPKKTSIYDVNGNLIKQSENVYDYQYARSYNTEVLDANGVPQTVPLNGVSCKCLPKFSKSKRSDHWMDPNNPDNNPVNYTKNMTSNSELLADIYNISTGRVELRNTIERVYGTGSTQYVESNKTFSYGKNYLPNKITTTQSNGDINETFTQYTIDSWQYGTNQGPALSALVQNNVLNLPVATRSTVKKASNNNTYDLSETFTKYGKSLFITGDIKPLTIFTKRYDVPQLVTPSTQYFNGFMPGFNVGYTAIKSFEYHNDGEMLCNINDEFNNLKSYIYDYNDKYIIANIYNAKANNNTKTRSFHTSFETTKSNGVEVIGTPNFVTGTSITGKRSFELNASNSLRITDPAECSEYKLTFWANSSVNIAALNAGRTVTLITSGPTYNGFTFYEYKLSTCTQTPLLLETVTISGNANIDEVRLYPIFARMTTSTYDPLIGKTSECDENNRITYYTYDEKGRLRFVKDEKSNIVKMYEYNNAVKKPIACPGQPNIVYSNLAASEVFYRDNCKTGEVALPITYTVPAGTYTSTISQEVVDMLVQQDLQTNGQAYANTNGICVLQYSNIEMSEIFTKEDCEDGYKGTTITYTVPAGTYFSTISQAAANALATAEINANGQAFANAPGNATCVIDTDPDFEAVDPMQTQCGTGALAGHLMVLATDVNPNSPSHGNTQWTDGGLDASCGGTVTPLIDITYTNAGNTQATVKFTSVATNLVYTLTLNPNTTTTSICGFVPAGNYNVKVILPFGSNAHNITVYNNTQIGTFNASNVNVTTFGLPIVRVAF
jgi:hypothetical protein